MKLARHYIDGEWRGGDAALRDGFNPADGSVPGQFRPGSKALADEAAQVARRTFFRTGWTGSPRQRAQALYEFADRMEAAKEEVTDLIVAENGKPRAEAQAVHMANATVYGLAASIFTKDLNRAMRVSRAIRSGTVWLNSHLKLLAEAKTGGYGQSGLGRLHGVEGLNDFPETKHVYLEAGAAPGA